jgi:hypothetical protein
VDSLRREKEDKEAAKAGEQCEQHKEEAEAPMVQHGR